MLGPEYGPKFLNTSFANSFLPGIVAKYGLNQPMKIGLSTKEAPTSFFKPNELGLDLNPLITVYVNDDVAVEIEVLNADAAI